MLAHIFIKAGPSSKRSKRIRRLRLSKCEKQNLVNDIESVIMFCKKPVDAVKKIPMTPYAVIMAKFSTTDPYLSDADLMWYAGWMVNCFVYSVE